MTVNVPLLQQTMAQIEASPDHWHQEAWRCESGMCFAGWASTLAGHQWAHGPADSGADNLLASERTLPGQPEEAYDIETDRYVPTGLQIVPVYAQAQADLGLSERDAEILFDGANGLEDLRGYVERLARGERLEIEDDYDEEEEY